MLNELKRRISSSENMTFESVAITSTYFGNYSEIPVKFRTGTGISSLIISSINSEHIPCATNIIVMLNAQFDVILLKSVCRNPCRGQHLENPPKGIS